MQTPTGTRQEEENNIAILQQHRVGTHIKSFTEIVGLNVLFKTINIKNEKRKMRRFNAQGSYDEMCEQYRRERRKSAEGRS